MSDSIRNHISALANGKGCSNAGLALEKYAKTVDSKERKGDDGDDKAALFVNVAGCSVSPLYKRAYERWKAQIDALPNRKTEVVKTVDRVIVGLGSESVLETAITLNRIYGVPMLPGSALKGVARSYYEKELKPADDEEKKKHRETGEELFGWEATKGEQGKESEKSKSGCVTFFDAWYVPGSAKDDKPLQPDVITVHHPNYYQNSGAEPPTDFDDPTPVGFISARGSFLLAVQGPSKDWSELAMAILTAALEHYGVGGKTSSGYGRLVVDGPAQIPGSPAPQPATQPMRAPTAPPPDHDVQAVKSTQPSQVKGKITGWLQKWQQRQKSDPAKARALAEAIRDKVDEAGGPDRLGPDKGNYLKMKTWLEPNP